MRSHGWLGAFGIPWMAAALGGFGCDRAAPASSAPTQAPPGVSTSAANAPHRAFVAYASGYGPSIDVFSVDSATGVLTPRATYPSFGPASSFLAVDPSGTHLYAIDEGTPGRVGAYRIDPTSGGLTFVNAVSSGGSGPAHVSLDVAGRYALIANYGDGSVSVLPIDGGQDG